MLLLSTGRTVGKLKSYRAKGLALARIPKSTDSLRCTYHRGNYHVETCNDVDRQPPCSKLMRQTRVLVLREGASTPDQ